MNAKVIILGGGVAGIGASKALENSLVLEKEDRIGGLCSNFTINGFRFDNAVHLSFSESPAILSLLRNIQFNTLKPLALNYTKGYWLRQPIQNDLYTLPTSEKIKIIESFLCRPKLKKINNYYDWLLNQYGTYFVNHYSEVYTKKYWTLSSKKLSTDWIGNRVRKASIGEILQGALEKNDTNYYYAKEMHYPCFGGYFSLFDQGIDKMRFFLNSRIKSIDVSDKTILDTKYGIIHFDRLISSLPIPVLIQLLRDVPVKGKRQI